RGQVRGDGKGRHHHGEVARRPWRSHREATGRVGREGPRRRGDRGMTLRIAMAQFDFPGGDVAGNADRIVEYIEEARDDYGADLVLFPELALSGYPPEDLLLRPGFLADCHAAMERIAEAADGIVAVVGWPESHGSVVYNAASILRD